MFAFVSWEAVRANSATLSPTAPNGVQLVPNPQQSKKTPKQKSGPEWFCSGEKRKSVEEKLWFTIRA
jgi:hypothetical protein